MKTFIGTKIIRALPMSRADYNKLRGWTLPADENGNDAGYLVEYLDGGKPNLEGFTGYVSWSPKEQFEAAYLSIGDVSGLAPHQQRVVAEKAELDSKRSKLLGFFTTAVFTSLPQDEKNRLFNQSDAMLDYSVALHERIDAFQK